MEQTGANPMLTRIAFKAPSPISYLGHNISRVVASVVGSLAGKSRITHSKKRLAALGCVFAFLKENFMRFLAGKMRLWRFGVISVSAHAGQYGLK